MSESEYQKYLRNILKDEVVKEYIKNKINSIKIFLEDKNIINQNFDISLEKITTSIYNDMIENYLNNLVIFTISDIQKHILKLFYDINKKYEFNTIIGIPRGGTILATILAYIFSVNKKEKDIIFIPKKYPYDHDLLQYPIIKLNKQEKKALKDKKILLVDDGILTGKTMFKFKNEIQKYAKDVKTVTLNYNKTISEFKPDFFDKTEDKLVQFPWKFLSKPLHKNVDGINLYGLKEYKIIHKYILNKKIPIKKADFYSALLEEYTLIYKEYDYEIINNIETQKEILYIYKTEFSSEIILIDSIIQLNTLFWNNIFEKNQNKNNSNKKYQINLDVYIPLNILQFHSEQYLSSLHQAIKNLLKKHNIEIIEIKQDYIIL